MRKIVRGFLAVTVLVFLLILSVSASDTETRGTGRVRIEVYIMPELGDGDDLFVEVFTDEPTMLSALTKAGLIAWENAPWGYQITSANGREAEPAFGEYWHVYHGSAETDAYLALAPGQDTAFGEDDFFYLSLEADWEEVGEDTGQYVAITVDPPLPWPAKWPEVIPPMEGNVSAYFGWNDAGSLRGLGVAVAGNTYESMSAYILTLERAGFVRENPEDFGDAYYDDFEDDLLDRYENCFLSILNGFGYRLYVSEVNMECRIFVTPL